MTSDLQKLLTPENINFLKEVFNMTLKENQNALYSIFGQNHKRDVLYIKIAASATRPIILNELKNKKLVYFYMTANYDISFKTNLWDLMPKSHDYDADVGITEEIYAGGFIDFPLGFNRDIYETIKFSFTATTANATIIKLVFHTTEID